MAAPFFKINGTDILPYVVSGGLKWKRSDLESDDAGRTMDGLMARGRVATKLRWDVEMISLTSEIAKIVLNLIYPEFVEVETNIDPMYGYYIKTFYSNNNPATCMHIDDDTGLAMWDGITFPLVER